MMRKASKSDIPEIARFIVKNNELATAHCIHSDMGGDIRATEKEISTLWASKEVLYWIEEKDEHIIGLMGCEYDLKSGRGWMRGPLSTEDKIPAYFEDLHNALVSSLPNQIKRMDSFLNEQNRSGFQFYTSMGYTIMGETHVYHLERKNGMIWEKQKDVHEVSAETETSFIDMHDSIFPETYVTGEQILSTLGKWDKVFVSNRGGENDGYVYVTVDKDMRDGVIEFIGVIPGRRHQGTGKILLQQALSYLFEEGGCNTAHLTVNDSLINAKSLYQSVGFTLKYTGVNQRLIL